MLKSSWWRTKGVVRWTSWSEFRRNLRWAEPRLSWSVWRGRFLRWGRRRMNWSSCRSLRITFISCRYTDWQTDLDSLVCRAVVMLCFSCVSRAASLFLTLQNVTCPLMTTSICTALLTLWQRPFLIWEEKWKTLQKLLQNYLKRVRKHLYSDYIYILTVILYE